MATTKTKLNFSQEPFTNEFCVTNDSYDGAPDAGPQAEGWGLTPMLALADYFISHLDEDTQYIIDGKALGVYL
jgi:hypothetical protein